MIIVDYFHRNLWKQSVQTLRPVGPVFFVFFKGHPKLQIAFQSYEDENGMELSIHYGGSDSEDEDGDLYSLPTPAVLSPASSVSIYENEDVTLEELVPLTGPVAAAVAEPDPVPVNVPEVLAHVPVPEPTPSTSAPPEKGGRKRRRAVSPGALQADTRRIRLESYQEVLASLSLDTQDMICRAAEVGIDRTNIRPRVINRRHAVSHEFPVPQEVMFLIDQKTKNY